MHRFTFGLLLISAANSRRWELFRRQARQQLVATCDLRNILVGQPWRGVEGRAAVTGSIRAVFSSYDNDGLISASNIAGDISCGLADAVGEAEPWAELSQRTVLAS